MAEKLIVLWLLCTTWVSMLQCQTLDYTMTEENQVTVVLGSILQGSNLTQQYSPDVVQVLRLRIIESDEGFHEYFEVTSSGDLVTRQQIDREMFCSFLLNCVIPLDVEVYEPRDMWEIYKVTVTIQDINDNSPEFEPGVFDINLSEVTPPGILPVSLPVALDADSPIHGVSSYNLTDASGTFSLNIVRGTDDVQLEPVLVVNSELDRETVADYTLVLSAIDKGDPVLSGSVVLQVNVVDVNDHYPKFENASYDISVYEDIEAWTNILTTKATDKDEGLNGEVLYSLKAQNEDIQSLFEINENTGDIYVIGELDFEKQSSYTLTVVARNKDQFSISSQAKVFINLKDVNDNPPSIKLKTGRENRVSVPENEEADTFVAHISVTDRDSGTNGQFDCTSSGTVFTLQRINENDFKLITNFALDHEVKSEYTVDIQCEDKGIQPLFSSIRVIVTVTDVNDNYPVFEQDNYTATIDESNELFRQIMVVKADDNDEGDNGLISYSIHSLLDSFEGLFQIDPNSGTVTNVKPLDHEASPEIVLEVTATDHGVPPKNSSATLIIDLIDIDDEHPHFEKTSYNLAVHEHKPSNSFVDMVKAYDMDTPPHNQITYSIQPIPGEVEIPPFRIGKKSGDLYTTKELDREEEDSYKFTVIAQGPWPNNWQTSTPVKVYVIDVNDNSPHFTFPNSMNNTVSAPYIIPAGTVITTVSGLDQDSGENAILHYSIIHDDQSRAFDIDEYTGTIVTIRDYESTGQTVILALRLRDNIDTHFDTTFLNIVFLETGDGETLKTSGDVNQSIVIGIAVTAGIVVTALVLTIVFLLCRRRRVFLHQNTLMAIKTRLEPRKPTGNPESYPNTLDVSFQSAAEKSSLQSGHLNNGLIYDPEKDSILVQPWREGPVLARDPQKQVMYQSRSHTFI